MVNCPSYSMSSTSGLIRIAVIVFVVSSSCVHAQISDKQYTVATAEEHFRIQASSGQKFSFPILELTSGSRDGHFGTLRTNKDNHPDYRPVKVTYRLSNQVPDGAIVFVEYDMPAFTQSFLVPNHGSVQTIAPRPKRIPAENKVEGPFLMVAPEIAKLPKGTTFEPEGLWIVNGTIAVELSKDGKTDRQEIWKLEKMKPKVVELPEHPAIFTGSFRRWKNSKGNPLFEGIFLDRDEQKKSVRFYTEDKRVSEIAFFELSLSDRKWISEEVVRRESKGANPTTTKSGKNQRK